MHVRPSTILPAVMLLATLAAQPAHAAEWFVAPGGTGKGSSASPFGRIQDALAVAQPGDIVTVRPGSYTGRIVTVRGGTPTARITLRSERGRGTVVVTSNGEVLEANHAYFAVDGLVFDGQYGAGRTLDINAGATAFLLRNSEVRRSGRDCVDLSGPRNVVIDATSIHHCLNPSNGGTDAHGIVAGSVRDLTLRNAEIHTFSGDGFQADPGRSSAGWGGVTIEGSRIWLEPLTTAANWFPAGAVTGENAVDTKVAPGAPRATIVIRNTMAWGFRHGRITNQAAFNLKENTEATLDRVTVRDSEIAFRTRGPSSSTGGKGAWVTLKNVVVHDVSTAVRYENNIEVLRLWNSTLGLAVSRPFVAASSKVNGLDVRNTLVTAAALPKEASKPSNRAVTINVFADAADGDYHLVPNASPIDVGETLAAVATDRDGVARPQGRAYDIGAFEYKNQVTPDPTPDADAVIHARHATTISGAWRLVSDTSAAGGVRLTHPDAGAARQSAPSASPTNYLEIQFHAEANRAYRIWIRARADRDSVYNDSAWIQFDGSVDAQGQPTWRTGTTRGVKYALQDCSGCGVDGWGWQDLGAIAGLGQTVRFARTGMQTLRLQTREDGLSIDQVVVSPATFLEAAPGATRQDTTILAETL